MVSFLEKVCKLQRHHNREYCIYDKLAFVDGKLIGPNIFGFCYFSIMVQFKSYYSQQ
ncbi:hypothetical protein GYH30_013761 [Glycine max]|uniref:Uncharacterized protein n=1 Tax=Glycine max TaxID=3847 RepID=A0A0R0JA55_SOYBN|nr:hypothetical protein GYH30_013761 [Glycine max]